MNYEEFKIAMTAKVANLAGEEVSVNLHRIPKNNGIVLDAITVRQVDEHVAPTLYLKDYYMRYKEGETLETLAQEILEINYSNHLKGHIPEDFYMNFERVKDRICMKLVNYDRNKEMLSQMPHKSILDLAIVFYYLLDRDILDGASVPVHNRDMIRWDTNVETLYSHAIKNTPVLLSELFSPLNQIMREMLEAEGVDATGLFSDQEDNMMYLLTNQDKYYGAACILYPETLQKIANHFQKDLYILPSSIHECILLPDSGQYSRETLKQMVEEVNSTQVPPEEVLSDEVYFYDRKLDRLMA